MPKFVYVSSDTNNECSLGIVLDNMFEALRDCALPVAVEGREVTKREASKWLADGMVYFHTAHLKGVKSLSERFPHSMLVRKDLTPGKVAGQFPFATGDELLLVTSRDQNRSLKQGEDKRYVYFLCTITTALELVEVEQLRQAS